MVLDLIHRGSFSHPSGGYNRNVIIVRADF